MKLFFQYSLRGFSNVYLAGPDGPGSAFIVDPSTVDEALLSFIENNGYTVNAVLVTHNHPNHVRGISTLRKIYDVDLWSASGEVLDLPTKIVNDRDLISAAGFEVEVLSLPGHTPDSVAYRLGNLVFIGDSLSAGLGGTTNSDYASSQLLSNLWQKILSLPDDTILLPGHGPPTTVRAERLYNVGLAEQRRKQVSRFRDVDLFMDS